MFVLLPNKSALRHNGFTLIELIVAVAIMSLLVGGAITGFITFAERQEVQTTAKNLQQLLRTAQAKARIREVPTACTAPNKRLQSYRVRLNQTSPDIVMLCGVGADRELIIPTDRESVVIPTGITVTSDAEYIDFYTLHQGVYIGSDVLSYSDRLVTIDGDVADWCFTIHTSGAITEPIDCTTP